MTNKERIVEGVEVALKEIAMNSGGLISSSRPVGEFEYDSSVFQVSIVVERTRTSGGIRDRLIEWLGGQAPIPVRERFTPAHGQATREDSNASN